jgi:N-acetylglucosamine-6-sulfatase
VSRGSAWPSILPLAKGQSVAWRKELLYEYYWERNYPHPPTVFALHGHQYKFIRFYGVWDFDELFDLRADPLEMNNLAYEPELSAIAKQMSDRLFAILKETAGRFIPLYPDRFLLFNKRTADAGGGAGRAVPARVDPEPGREAP